MGLAIEESVLGSTKSNVPDKLYTLKNSNGMRIQVSELGAALVSVQAPGRDGNFGECVLGYESPTDWEENPFFIGVTVGRVANRIGGARFKLQANEYTLTANDGENQLHSGPNGLHSKRWSSESKIHDDAVEVIFSTSSPDGEDGFPGNLKARVSYRLTNHNELVLDYSATTDQPTPVNLTNHAYWNLAGGGLVMDHVVQLNADRYLELNENLIPTGNVVSVENSPMDLRNGRRLGMEENGGIVNYDNYWVASRPSDLGQLFGRVSHPPSGRVMEIYTTEPGAQFYNGNFLNGEKNNRNGEALVKYSGLCIETHGYPDAPNHPNFPSVILEPGRSYSQTTIHRFLTEN